MLRRVGGCARRAEQLRAVQAEVLAQASARLPPELRLLDAVQRMPDRCTFLGFRVKEQGFAYLHIDHNGHDDTCAALSRGSRAVCTRLVLGASAGAEAHC